MALLADEVVPIPERVATAKQKGVRSVATAVAAAAAVASFDVCGASRALVDEIRSDPLKPVLTSNCCKELGPMLLRNGTHA